VGGDVGAFAKKVAQELGVRVVEIGKADKAVYRVVSGDRVFDFSPIRGQTIQDDLKGRDFTINGLGFDLSSETLVDPVGGLDDIRSGTIRLISEEAISADPLRMLRAFRLAAVLGFQIIPQTLSIIKEHVGLAGHSAEERIRAELFGMAEAEKSFPFLKQMFETGLLMKLIPELEPSYDCPPADQGENVFEHIMRTYEEMETLLREYPTIWPDYVEQIRSYLTKENRKVLLKWAALLHDLGKPATRSIDATGRLRYLAHEEKGTLLAGNVCLRLRMSGQERSYVELLVGNHLHPLHLFDARQRGTLSTRGLVRFVRKHEDHIIGLLFHSMADQRAKATCTAESGKAYAGFLNEILSRYFREFKPTMKEPRLITGKDLIEHFGLKPSELFKTLLQKVEDARVSQEILSRDDALKLVARLLELEGDARVESAAKPND
jgi:tRNA nucleotidyltransferase/poly(A) polymerase